MRAVWFVMLMGCTHENGCDGNYAERYAKFLDPSVECRSIRYGQGSRDTDYALCTVPYVTAPPEQWLCTSNPDQCRVLGEVVRVQRVRQ